MSYRRLVSLILIVFIMISSLTACNTEVKVLRYNIPESLNQINGDLVAENNNFKLSFDSEYACILLENKINGTVWSTIPYEAYSLGENSSSLSSPIYIQYYNPTEGGLETSKAYNDCISEGNFSVKKIENGISIKFYFIDAEITVQMNCILRNDSLEVSIPLEEIEESGKTRLIDISVLPYLCSVKNSPSNEDYLMLPVGSGALAYTDEEKTEISRVFTGDVYGVDYGRQRLDNTIEEEKISLPVYGVKAGNDALFAIIKEGSGAARLDAETGNYRNGYSTAYSTFQVRSYDEVEAERNNYSDERVYALDYEKNLTYKIDFYPLADEKANYSGMAECYRNYLGLSNAKKNSQNSFSLEVLGGALTKHFIMGVPYYSMTTATTFDKVKEIIDDILKTTSNIPMVTLKGFGNSGISVGKIAGGYSFSSKLGGKKGFTSVEKYCTENSVTLYTDYDVLHFNKSADNFSTIFDIAKTASMQKTVLKPLSLNLRVQDKAAKKIYLLKRDNINIAIDKLITTTNKYNSGISLSTLGNIAYSDYSSSKYYSKGSLKEIGTALEKVGKSGHSVSVSGANDYAAIKTDVITDISLSNGKYRALDIEIPFYQLVFSSKALYSEPLNFSADINADILKLVESGVSPTFTVCDKYSEDFSDLANNEFYNSVYSNVKQKLINISKMTSEFYKSIDGSTLVSHSILQDGVTQSKYSNGVSVVVNHTDLDVTFPEGTIKANSYSLISIERGVTNEAQDEAQN